MLQETNTFFYLALYISLELDIYMYGPLLRRWRRRSFHGTNAMILMPQIFDAIGNENVRYKRNELE